MIKEKNTLKGGGDMTKKDYIRFAEIIRVSKTADEMVSRMIAYFQEDNAKFDSKKFMEACLKKGQA